jgi:hypothetical protein
MQPYCWAIPMKHRSSVFLFALLFSGCVAPQSDLQPLPIDQAPMYGGVDRQSVPELKKADDAFVESTSAAFGGREKAAKRWVDEAFASYHHKDLETAMRRFNQAWLLDPNNPAVYWGFGAILHDRGSALGAYDMGMRAYKLGFRDPSFLADLGRAAALRIVETKDLPPDQRAAFIAESESYYEEAITNGEALGYIYDSWATAKYWMGDYAGAWEKVKSAQAHGSAPDDDFLSLLAQKMPEPK